MNLSKCCRKNSKVIDTRQFYAKDGDYEGLEVMVKHAADLAFADCLENANFSRDDIALISSNMTESGKRRLLEILDAASYHVPAILK